MLRTSTAWAASCAAVLLTLSGCRFFGIDNRPDIRYVTEKERKEVAEPMYSMAVPGTRLFKQWPMRLGPNYGYAPWEKKQGVVMANAPAEPGANVAAGNAANASAGTPAQDTAAAKPAPNKAMVMAETAAKSAVKPGKPSGRATPLLPGELPADSAMAANEAWSGSRVGAADGAVAVADDFDVPVAARDDLEFRTPGAASPSQSPKSADAVVARTTPNARAARPPVAKNLAWRDAAEELDATSTNDELYVSEEERTAPTATASDIGLQQPGAFAARKPVAAKPRARPKRATSSNNVLRDEAVRPASATIPAAVPKSTPRTVLPVAEFTSDDWTSVDEALAPPSEEELGADPLERLPVGMTDAEAVREEPEMPTRTTRPRLVAPPVMRGSYENGEERAGAYHPASEQAADDEVFVTASDMSDELPYRDAGTAMLRAHIDSIPHSRSRTTNESPREYANPHYRNDAAGQPSEFHDEVEAAKRAVLQ